MGDDYVRDEICAARSAAQKQEVRDLKRRIDVIEGDTREHSDYIAGHEEKIEARWQEQWRGNTSMKEDIVAAEGGIDEFRRFKASLGGKLAGAVFAGSVFVGAIQIIIAIWINK